MSNLSQQLSPFLWIVLLSTKTYHLLHTTRLWKSFRSLFIKFCKNVKIFPVLSNNKPLQSLFLALEIKSFESDNHSVASWWQNLVNVAQGEGSYTVFWLTLLYSLPYFFFRHQSLSCSLCSFWCYFVKQRWGSLNQPSANVFVLRDFNVHEVWWTYSCVTGRPGEFYYNCSISDDFIQNINFHTWIPGFDSHGLALLDLLLSSDPSLCSAMVFPPWGNFGHIVSVTIEFRPNWKGGCSLSLHSLWLFLCWLKLSSWWFKPCFVGGCFCRCFWIV